MQKGLCVKNIWGKVCDCGNEVFDYFDESPYICDSKYEKIIVCKKCKQSVHIKTCEAIEFYHNKIFKCFQNVCGNVLELGCGDGLLTGYLAGLPEVKKIVAIDKENTFRLKSNKVEFIKIDLDNFDQNIFKMNFDFVVCKDILMYLKDIDYTISRIAKISKNLILLNWFNKEHKNCLNKTEPEQILSIIKKYFDKVDIEYPEFYKWGYLIKARQTYSKDK